MIKLITVNEYPPIPDRRWDWHAFWDGDEETGDYGYGKTEQEAIDDLLSEHPPCKNESTYVRGDGGCLRCDADQGETCRGETP